jgi:hypothetical protein
VHRKNIGGVDIITLNQLGRQVIVLESAAAGALEKTLLDLLVALRKVVGTEDEPMVNILCSFSEVDWRVIVFPRSKHRPDAYFKPGDEQVMISPAAVDIGGLIITPLERDFTRIDAAAVESIFSEVSLPAPLVDKAIDMVS